MSFEELLKKKGFSDPGHSEYTQQDFINDLIQQVTQNYPLNQINPPNLGQFLLQLIVTDKQNRSTQNLDQIASKAWSFYRSAQNYSDSQSQIGIYYRFLNGTWNTQIVAFYIKAKRLIYQLKLGDNAKYYHGLQDLVLDPGEWVQIATQIFAQCIKPTSCVNRITGMLADHDYINKIPAHIFLNYCVQQFADIKLTGNPPKALKSPIASLFYKRPSGLLNNNLHSKPSQVPKRKPPPNFDWMQYGKSRSKKPVSQIKQKKESLQPFCDQELNNAVIQEPQVTSTQQPKYYSLNKPQSWTDMRNSLQTQLQEYQRDLQQIIQQRDRIKEALEQTVDFCDTVSYEHDILLIQNKNLKKLVSQLSSKIMEIQPSALKEIDLSELLNDQCRDIKPTGILKQEQEQDYYESPQKFDMPFSHTAGQHITKERKVPPTPKFVLDKQFDDDLYEAVLDHTPSQMGLLPLSKGDIVKKISELEDWIFGENLNTGIRGFFPPECIKQ